jgi:hypothetical protein
MRKPQGWPAQAQCTPSIHARPPAMRRRLERSRGADQGRLTQPRPDASRTSREGRAAPLPRSASWTACGRRATAPRRLGAPRRWRRPSAEPRPTSRASAPIPAGGTPPPVRLAASRYRAQTVPAARAGAGTRPRMAGAGRSSAGPVARSPRPRRPAGCRRASRAGPRKRRRDRRPGPGARQAPHGPAARRGSANIRSIL